MSTTAHPPRATTAPTPPPDLDALLPPEAAAVWLGVTKRTLLNLVRRKRVPVVRLNSRVFRFHPRTILATQ